jgi:glycosyltransferase involved in cell wall biosynthesis
MKLLDIIIPCFNTENLNDYLDSIYPSKNHDLINIILVEDRLSKKLIYTDSDLITYIKNEGVPGVSSNKNLGICNSNSKYIYIVDHDDKFEKRLKLLKVNALLLK